MILQLLSFVSSLRYERIGLKTHSDFVTSGSPSSATIIIPHNMGLGKPPFVRLFFSLSTYTGYFQMFNGGTLTLDRWSIDSVTVDNNNITINVTWIAGSGTGSGTVYCRVYSEPQS